MKLKLLLIACVVISMHAASQGNLIITNGATCTTINNAAVIVNDLDFINNGAFGQGKGAGTLKFTGSSNSIISGNPVNVDNLVLSKQNNATVFLQTNITVASYITFNGGLLDIGNSMVDLGLGGMLTGESESSRAISTGTGYLQSSGYLNQPFAVNPGNLGGTISSSANLGLTIIQRGSSSLSGQGLNKSVLRFYNIMPSNNTALNATLRLQYFDAELNGIKAANLSVYKDTIDNAWTDEGYSLIDTLNKFLERNNINNFSTFTLSASQGSLPVNFTSFNLACNTGIITAEWQTAQEINSKIFYVQSTLSGGVAWATVAKINAAGNSAVPHSYSVRVEKATDELTEYRIAEVDENGRVMYSNTKLADCIIHDMLSVYPNPVANTAVVNIKSANAAQVNLLLTDAKGAVVRVQRSTLSTGYNIITLDMLGLAKGAYILTANWPQNIYSVKIIKN